LSVVPWRPKFLSVSIIPNDLQATLDLYHQWGLTVENVLPEPESREYDACTFLLNGKKIRFRVAKITPAKQGLFVTIWKRNAEGITVPFDSRDEIDFVVISVREGSHWGQFVFPTAILINKRVMTHQGKEGKRGIRVYPPWCTRLNAQATKTQQWQSECFVQLNMPTAYNTLLRRYNY